MRFWENVEKIYRHVRTGSEIFRSRHHCWAKLDVIMVIRQSGGTATQISIVMKQMRRDNPSAIRKQGIKKERQKAAGCGGQSVCIIQSLTRKSRPMIFELLIKGLIFSRSYLIRFCQAEAVISEASPARSSSRRFLNQLSHMGSNTQN